MKRKLKLPSAPQACPLPPPIGDMLTPEPVWVCLNFIYWLVFGCAGSPLPLGLSLVAAKGACSLVAGPGLLSFWNTGSGARAQ